MEIMIPKVRTVALVDFEDKGNVTGCLLEKVHEW
jgi:hypothetical protein